MTINRRNTERIPLASSVLHATWLNDWLKIDETGILTDISPGGFGGLMHRAPALGHLFHARLCLKLAEGESSPIEVDAQLRRLQKPDDESKTSNTWAIHCAIESIHPTDKRLLMRAIRASRRSADPGIT